MKERKFLPFFFFLFLEAVVKKKIEGNGYTIVLRGETKKKKKEFVRFVKINVHDRVEEERGDRKRKRRSCCFFLVTISYQNF